jgi:hypothetical protein
MKAKETGEPIVTTGRVGGVLLLAALATAVWFAWRTPAEAPHAEPAQLGFPTAWANPEGAQRAASSGAATALAAAAALIRPAALGASGPACGIEAAASVPDATVWTPDRVAAFARARERLRSALSASADEVARASAFLLPVVVPPAPNSCPDATRAFGVAAAVVASCVQAQALSAAQAAEQAQRNAARGQADALARLALGTRSPLVYGLAWKNCQSQAGEAAQGGACPMLSVDQWARLSPGNAIPWLELAQQADARGDAAGVADAMFRASKAQSVDAGWHRLGEFSFTHAPHDNSLLDTWAASGEITRWVAAWSMASYRMASLYCEPKPLLDANHRQQCADIAELFVARGTSLHDLSLGLALGQRVGWSAARLSALSLERDALSAVLLQQIAPLSASLFNCDTLQREQARVIGVAQLGELRLARERLAASGLSVQDWARERSGARVTVATGAAASRP